MTSNTAKGPRIPFPEPDELEPDIRAFVEQGRLNVIRLMAGASPEVVRTLQQFSYSFYKASPLPADLREVAILRVGYLSGSAYEVHQHIGMARAIGFTDTQLDAIARADLGSPALDVRQKAVIAYVDDIVVNVRANDDTLATLSALIPRDQLIDLTLLTGLYMTVARLLETAGVALDDFTISPGSFD